MNQVSVSRGSMDLFAAGRRPAVRLVVAAGLVFYFMYHITRFEPARITLSAPNVDTSILFTRAHQIFSHADYPARLSLGNFNEVFPYPPSAVLILAALGWCGQRVFIAVWILLMIAGLLVSFRASVCAEDGDVQSAWLAIGAISLVFCDSPVSWDLRSGNSNLVYLGLVLAAYALARRRPWLAGVFLGLSISLKLYSALILLWLSVNRPKKALYGAAITIGILWIAAPLVLFGLDGTIHLYGAWREQLRIVSGLWVYPVVRAESFGPPLITLRRTVVVLTGARPDAAMTQLLLEGIWSIWLASLLWYAWRAVPRTKLAAPSRAALADWTVLMMAPLPFSPWLEPYHEVPLLPATILCLVIALDKRGRGAERRVGGAALAALLAIRAAGIPLPIRGLALMAQFLVVLIALGILRPFMTAVSDSVVAQAAAAG